MSGAKAFGVQSPSQGEDAVSWVTWSDGAGGAPTIIGDADWGKLSLDYSGNEGRSAVYDLGSIGTRTFTLTRNRYGTGTGSATLQYRYSDTTFSQDALTPAWITYNSAVSLSCRYIQVREITGFLAVSANGRYLVLNGSPWLMAADSPQGMLSDLTPSEMATYMSNRAGYGVNCIQVHLISGATFGGTNTTFPLEDSTTPFTTTGDIATPREAYFSQVDDMINLAATYGMVVMLTAAETIDGSALWKNNGTTKCTNFGAYLGARYKSFPNIIWNFGNDYQPTVDTDLDDCIDAVYTGIRSADTNHLCTGWLMPAAGSPAFESTRDDTTWNSAAQIDFLYLYSVLYSKTLEDRALSPAMPIVMGESCYETENLGAYGFTTTAYHTRKINYWSVLSGACGTTYCNGSRTWGFAGSWSSELDTYTGIAHLGFMKTLLEAYNWHLLTPDNAHAVLTAGYGTYTDGGAINTNDYAASAWITDGSLMMIYMPTNRTMTVDMSKFSGTVTARWYDPTDGSYTADAASPLSNSGTHEFSRATTNAEGSADWVLVLEV